MNDAADVYRVYRLPVGLFLLQLDCDRSIGVSQHSLCGDLRIRGAHIGEVCHFPALFQLRGKHRDRDGDQYGNDRDHDQ